MKIFQRVRCKAYLKKVKDGVMLNCYDQTNPVSGNAWDHPISVFAIRGNYPNIEEIDLSAFEGETVDKTYRERVEENFSGFLVGITYIATAGEIGTDTSYVPIDMYGNTRETYHLTKETHRKKVGVVFFKNNAKRYVLLDDMEEEHCPLSELPPHGRLIDADELKKKFPHDEDWDYPVNSNRRVNEDIDDAPTIIEAEGERK